MVDPAGEKPTERRRLGPARVEGVRAPMTPEAFREALATLGLSAEWLARRCARSSRTGHDWRSGHTLVPAAVAAWLLRRLAQLDQDPPPQLPRRLDRWRQ